MFAPAMPGRADCRILSDNGPVAAHQAIAPEVPRFDLKPDLSNRLPTCLALATHQPWIFFDRGGQRRCRGNYVLSMTANTETVAFGD